MKELIEGSPIVTLGVVDPYALRLLLDEKKQLSDALESLNKEVKDLRDEVVAGDQDIEHLTEVLEHLIAGAVACVEVVVENERLFSENKMLDYKLKEEKKKTAELTADLKSRARCMKYWQELYSKCNKDLYELEQKK